MQVTINKYQWVQEWTIELAELIFVLTQTVELQEAGSRLLERILEGDLIDAGRIAETPKGLRLAPPEIAPGSFQID